jgi:transcriptional regulator with XRE-family HTH domain
MLLHERDVSLADIARRLGKSLSLVSRVNNGQRRSQTIEREISRRLDLSEQEAFPEWHDRRRRKTPRKNAKR